MDLGSVIGMSAFAFGMMTVIALLCAVLIRVIVAVLARAQDARARADTWRRRSAFRSPRPATRRRPTSPRSPRPSTR